MNKILLLLCCVFAFESFVAQKKDPSIVLYDKGNVELTKKNYRTADSLFSLSLKLSPHPDTYFNRAACRIKLKDFKGYCQDIGSAANYRDREAISIYYKECCKVDTIVNLKDGKKAIEFITTYKYNDNLDYEKYDGDTTQLVSYYISNNDTIYKSGKDLKLAMYGENDSLLLDFIERTKFSDWIKTNNSVGKISFTLLIDEVGKVKDVKIMQPTNNEFEVGLTNELYTLFSAIPANILGKNVKSLKTVNIIFAKKLVYTSTSNLTSERISKRATILEKPFENTADEVMPEFPGGVMEMIKFIQKNLQYPKIAKEAGLSGKCFIRFVVLKNGSIKNVNIVRGVPGCIECDVEAIRVIYAMPKWKPGMQKGKAVNVFYNLPINFQLR